MEKKKKKKKNGRTFSIKLTDWIQFFYIKRVNILN